LRAISISIIKDVESGRFLDETIDSIFSRSHLDEGKQSLIYQITSGVVRWRGYLEHVLSRYTAKPIDSDIRYLLWMSIYQVGFMKKAHYHVIKEAVDYAKKARGKFVAGFVNAVLRKFANDKEIHGLHRDEFLELTFPEWLAKRWLLRFGEDETKKLLSKLNTEPEFALRVDTSRITADEAIRRLGDIGIAARSGRFSPSAVIAEKLSPVIKSTLFSEGLISVQDEASQLAGMAVSAAKGRVILDACAGSRTKSKQIGLLRPDACVFSMDNDLKRLSLSSSPGNVICADAFRAPFKAASFDTILVDAPCSSLGIIRKHPEIKWRRGERDITEFGAYQFSLLQSIWDLLKRGGQIIYSVCSFEPEETLQVIDNLAKEKKFVLEKPLPFLFNKDYFLSLPHETAMDGFFIARMKKL